MASGTPTSGSHAKFAQGLPKSSFAWVDSEGNGHLPYKNKDGSINLAHVRNALARIGQVKGLTGEELVRVRNKLRAALRKAGGNPSGNDNDADDARRHSEAATAADAHLYYLGSARKLSDAPEYGPTAKWVQAFPLGEWSHPVYGDISFERDDFEEMKRNFDEGVMGQDVPWTYDHGLDAAKGGKAAGTIKKVEVRDDGLYELVEFTEQAYNEIENGEWLYSSPEYKPEWKAQHTGETYTNVLWGGALTNYPFLKGIAPINCSELFMFDDIVGEERELEHSEPGTGSPPAIRQDDNPVNPMAPSTPPDPDPGVKAPGAFFSTDEGGETVVDENQLREALGIDADADIAETIKEMREAREAVTIAAHEQDKARTFAEQYPEQHRQLAELRQRDREHAARAFAERYSNFRTESGRRATLSPKALEQVEEMHLKLSEGAIKAEDFTALLDGIVSSGVIELGERGHSIAPDGEAMGDPIAAARQLRTFAEEKMAANDKLDMQTAMRQAAGEHPELFEASNQRVKLGQRPQTEQVVEVVR